MGNHEILCEFCGRDLRSSCNNGCENVAMRDVCGYYLDRVVGHRKLNSAISIDQLHPIATRPGRGRRRVMMQGGWIDETKEGILERIKKLEQRMTALENTWKTKNIALFNHHFLREKIIP